MSAVLDTMRAAIGATEVVDVSAAILRDRVKAMTVLADELAVDAGTLEVGTADRVDAWSLRGAEVRLQEAHRLLQGAYYTLEALLQRLDAGASS